jgi:hypothetical protein
MFAAIRITNDEIGYRIWRNLANNLAKNAGRQVSGRTASLARVTAKRIIEIAS